MHSRKLLGAKILHAADTLHSVHPTHILHIHIHALTLHVHAITSLTPHSLHPTGSAHGYGKAHTIHTIHALLVLLLVLGSKTSSE